MFIELSVILKCDSLLEGWGSVIDNFFIIVNGRWFFLESVYYINYLEIKVVFFGLKFLCLKFKYCSIKVLFDNQIVVVYFRNMGGIYFRDCNQITREIILWCKDRDIFLIIIYLFGKLNVEVDKVSREFYDDMEWLLDVQVY